MLTSYVSRAIPATAVMFLKSINRLVFLMRIRAHNAGCATVLAISLRPLTEEPRLRLQASWRETRDWQTISGTNCSQSTSGFPLVSFHHYPTLTFIWTLLSPGQTGEHEHLPTKVILFSTSESIKKEKYFLYHTWRRLPVPVAARSKDRFTHNMPRPCHAVPLRV